MKEGTKGRNTEKWKGRESGTREIGRKIEVRMLHNRDSKQLS